MYDVYIICKIHGVSENSSLKDLVVKEKILVEVEGYFDRIDLICIESKKPWFLFEIGESIPRVEDLPIVMTSLSKEFTPDSLRKSIQDNFSKGLIKPVCSSSGHYFGMPHFCFRSTSEDLEELLKMIIDFMHTPVVELWKQLKPGEML